jgi:DNA modification methylase
MLKPRPDPPHRSNNHPVIAHRRLSDLRPNPNNPRTHSLKQIGQIANSIRRFGWTNSPLVDRTGMVVAGNGRLEAAKLLGLDEIPTISCDGWSMAEIRAYAIADNKIAENAGWDHRMLEIEFQYLAEFGIDFDLTLTGFETGEIDVIIGEAAETPDALDDVPTIDPSTPPASREGDLWLIGKHRLFCGDATKPGPYARLLDKERAQMVFIDPPYNVPIGGHVGGLGKVQHREFAMASGEMSEAEFTSFLAAVFRKLAEYSIDGSLHFVCSDWRHIGEMLAAGKANYTEFKNLITWVKTNGGMGSLYRSQHEIIFLFKNGKASHINNVELGKHGRYRSNVWTYPGINTFRKDRDEELAMHPTVKPLALVSDAILDCSKRGGLILDVFIGSGTTLAAAEKTGRRCYGMELDPQYVDVAIARMKRAFDINAIHAETGLSFEDIKAQRSGTATSDQEADDEC